MVTVVVGGGPNTVLTVCEAVTQRCPVVLIVGSGGAADAIAAYLDWRRATDLAATDAHPHSESRSTASHLPSRAETPAPAGSAGTPSSAEPTGDTRGASGGGARSTTPIAPGLGGGAGCAAATASSSLGMFISVEEDKESDEDERPAQAAAPPTAVFSGRTPPLPMPPALAPSLSITTEMDVGDVDADGLGGEGAGSVDLEDDEGDAVAAVADALGDEWEAWYAGARPSGQRRRASPPADTADRPCIHSCS